MSFTSSTATVSGSIEAADGVMLVVQGAMRHPLAEIKDPTTHAAA
jgi:hypothetical protein